VSRTESLGVSRIGVLCVPRTKDIAQQHAPDVCINTL
jgi:hypothetical protein